MIKPDYSVFYITLGLIVLTCTYIIYKMISWVVAIPFNLLSSVAEAGQPAAYRVSDVQENNIVVPNAACRSGFTKQGNICVKQCYEHPSLAELYKRPEKDITNKFAEYGVDDRWGNVSSSKDYCYMCPAGFELGKIDENDKKMYCTTRCPYDMANNIQAQTCYKGYLLCPQGESIEACELRTCPSGYTKQTNSLGQVLCVPNGASCPTGMKDNKDYIGCWKDKKEAVISTVEDLYILNSAE
jgi:hypothetical protein